jgi:hypothetical protein
MAGRVRRITADSTGNFLAARPPLADRVQFQPIAGFTAPGIAPD